MVNFNENLYGRRGTDGRTHIPALPFWVAIIRVIQLIFAFLVLVLAAYAGSVFPSWFDSNWFPGYAMSYFTFAWTLLFLIYIFLSPLFFPRIYHYWIHLGLEFLTTVFWLTTFALLANESSIWTAEQDAINLANSASSQIDQLTGADVKFGSFSKEEHAIKTSRAATAFAALDWVLFMVTLGLFAFFLHKHRVAHGATGFGGFGSSTRNGATYEAEKTQPGMELHNVERPQETGPAV